MKTEIKDVVRDLSQRAADCADLAKMQRKSADGQKDSSDHLHDEARKLEQLGDALKKDVAEIKEKLAEAVIDLSPDNQRNHVELKLPSGRPLKDAKKH